MGQVVRIISQLYDTDKDEVINEKVLHSEKIKSPKTLQQLGYKHNDQIKILQQAQDFKLLLQDKLINTNDTCPNCGKKTGNKEDSHQHFMQFLLIINWRYNVEHVAVDGVALIPLMGYLVALCTLT